MIRLLAFTMLISMTARAEFPEPFYSFAGSERKVEFTHVLETEMTSLTEVRTMGATGRSTFIKFTARPLMKFLFGPLTHRKIGGPQRNDMITARWEEAYVAKETGRVLVPIDYKATWILDKKVAESPFFYLPVPRNFQKMYTKAWQRCTDSAPEHATETFFWYYWDPERKGCDHTEGAQYDLVKVFIGEETYARAATYPEYERLFRDEVGTNTLKMTFAFGYVTDPQDPHPERDNDAGAYEYRSFLNMMGSRLPQLAAKPIHLNEYAHGTLADRIIGYRFTGRVNGYSVDIVAVIAAGVDQIYLFAESFAHRHDSVFAWMGHSRVGGGFDAALFGRIVGASPEYYSISSHYQLVYWGGCNSYSYYTLPFFEFKAAAFPQEDPTGTRGLDIIAHGLPSYFSFNAQNAEILLGTVLSYPRKTSYQDLIRNLETTGTQSGVLILAAVLGDEDNEP